jgi:cyanate permease
MMEKSDLDHDALVSAMGHALRSVTVRLIACVGAGETQNAMFAEALSIASGRLTSSEIAAMLRGLAEKIDAGYLENTSIQ